jgi:hypothetical protein
VPPLTYEQAETALRASQLVPAAVTADTLCTTMLKGTEDEMARWQDLVLLAVVRALVHRARVVNPQLPNLAWVGELRVRTVNAANRVKGLSKLQVGEVTKLRDEVVTKLVRPLT